MDGDGLFGVVPNFSEGRRTEVVDAIVDALHVPGARVVYAEADPDHHRLDTTVLGSADAVRASAMAGAADGGRADRHARAHGRASAHGRRRRDPVHAGARRDDGASASRSPANFGRELAERLELPVYLYDRAALVPERASLADVRRGEFGGCGTPSRAANGFPTSARTGSGRRAQRRSAPGSRSWRSTSTSTAPTRRREGDREGVAGVVGRPAGASGRSASRCPSGEASSRCR